MRRRFASCFAVLCCVLALALPTLADDGAESADAAAQEAGRLSTNEVAHSVLSALDKTADPCQDFYQYACGGWLASEELPSDQTRWARSFSVIQERNRQIINTMLEDAAADPGEDSERQKIGYYYASCMDEATLDKRGHEPLKPLLAEIETVQDVESLLRVTGVLHRQAIGALFAGSAFPDFKNPDMNISFFFQGGLGMPDRDYYVSDDATKQELLKAYEAHVARMLGLIGTPAEDAAAQAAQVVAFETTLAENSRPRAAMRVIEKLYNKLDLEGLQKLTPKLPWDVYFKAIGHPDIVDISVATPEFFEAMQDLVLTSEPEVLQTYLRWQLIAGTAAQLSSDFLQANFEFYGQKVQGQKEMQPRWKRCVASTSNALGEVIGQLYVADHFAGSSKEVALEMIHDIEKAFEKNLPNLAWMDDTTRERAIGKAQAVGNKIGYPDEWRDYSSLKLSQKDFFHNVMASRAFEFDRNARKVGQPVDPNEWGMTPQMVNAYYNPLQNEIAFPAGILQPPFFHRDFPAAMNYGAVGAVMGHELSHGFDDQGRKFAPDGQMRQWWEEAASESFDVQASCVADLYSTYEIEPDVHVNGELTLGENIADLGGVKQAFNAFKAWETRQDSNEVMVDGLTNDQLFFVAFGQVWCSKTTPEQARLLVTTDSHSPPRFRVIGPVSNNPDFAEAFQCAENTPMNPKNRCEVW